ncbi:glycosyltransferase family 4 protein [Rhodococcoides corynebacterioides]|uniref:glycosyltransferase family 4 protein n=1 Tax=Rhodococcoides corynebacterioides TaxID=53972 RepID=UPI000830C819|nr:glycosyltransferase family 4 protein [Rhodococcus corynebacterioides]
MTAPVILVAHTANVSGAEKMLLSVLGEARRAGRPVTVLCPSGALADALPDEVRHVPIPDLGLGGQGGVARIAAAGRMLARWATAARVLRRTARADASATRPVVVINSLFALPAARLAGRGGGLPGGGSWLVHDAVPGGRQRAVMRLGLPGIDRVVACTEAAAAPVRALGADVRVVPYGVRWPVADFSGARHRPPVVGMLALLTPWKGHRVLLDAVARLDDVIVELAGGSFSGDQAYADELRSRAAQPDLAGRVRFLGHVDPDTVMAEWDVVVSSSVLPEAGPLSVLEAMAHGLPVVASDHGGPTEFLADGAGVLVPPGDADALAREIAALLADDERRATIGGRARAAVADRHDVATTLPNLVDALTAVAR